MAGGQKRVTEKVRNMNCEIWNLQGDSQHSWEEHSEQGSSLLLNVTLWASPGWIQVLLHIFHSDTFRRVSVQVVFFLRIHIQSKWLEALISDPPFPGGACMAWCPRTLDCSKHLPFLYSLCTPGCDNSFLTNVPLSTKSMSFSKYINQIFANWVICQPGRRAC